MRVRVVLQHCESAERKVVRLSARDMAQAMVKVAAQQRDCWEVMDAIPLPRRLRPSVHPGMTRRQYDANVALLLSPMLYRHWRAA